MKIIILSRGPSLFSTSRLRQAAIERGHEVRVIDYLRCYMNITSSKPSVIYAGESLVADAIIPRIGATYTFYGAAVVRQFEVMGVTTANGSQAISRSRDKLRALQILSHAGIGLPVTGFAHSSKDIDGVIGSVGGPPLIIKLLEGTQGVGVVLAETRKAAESVMAAFRQLDANILVQEFIKEAGGEDIRVLVIGGKAVAAMRRQAAPGEFRSNLHRGGTAKAIKLTQKERATAVKAARLLGLSVAGVDMLRSDRGPLVIEVNSSPGLEGIETFTGIDVAGKMIEWLETESESKSAQSGRARRNVDI